jgi:hypothetical protein
MEGEMSQKIIKDEKEKSEVDLTLALRQMVKELREINKKLDRVVFERDDGDYAINVYVDNDSIDVNTY